MRGRHLLFCVATLFVIGLGMFVKTIIQSSQDTGAPPYQVEDLDPPENIDPYAWIRDWKRAEGPARVGLQVGHWQNDQLPQELERLRGNTGASGGGKWEWEVNLAIAEETKKILEPQGIIVDILPATVPPQYWADVFISVHADGNLNTRKSGYKIASPRRDFSGKASELVSLLETHYEEQTSLTKDDNISRNMTGYYAFAWWRYEHAVHPRATSAIVETGFLTSPRDRTTIVSNPQKSAAGIANGILAFLESQKLL